MMSFGVFLFPPERYELPLPKGHKGRGLIKIRFV